MNLSRCANGHFFDKEKYATCPHCSGGAGTDESLTTVFTEDVDSNEVTAPVSPAGMGNMPTEAGDIAVIGDVPNTNVSGMSADEPTVAMGVNPFDIPTVPMSQDLNVDMEDDDDDHTIGIYDDAFSSVSTSTPAAQTVAAKPVNKVSTPCVGWLIAIGGNHIGTDFRLKVGKNFIGRDSKMDVALTEDKSVSRERHAIVVYEPKQHLYLIQPGESSGLVYRNNEVVLTPTKLEAFDMITVGEVNLLFMPLCGERFNWSDLFEQMGNK